jgi:small subunit ribosomal protein S16
MLKNHLLGGLRKGALTEEQVEEKFNAWLEEKDASVATKVGGLDKVKADVKAKALEAEKEINDKRAAEAAAALVPEPEPEVEAAAEEAVAEEAPVSALDAAVEEAKGDAAAPAEEK